MICLIRYPSLPLTILAAALAWTADPAARAEAVSWSADNISIDEADFAKLQPDNPDNRRLAAYQNAQGGIAIAAPAGAKDAQALVKGLPEVGVGQEFAITLDEIRATNPTGWQAVTVGLRNSDGQNVAVVFNTDSYFIAGWLPAFKSLTGHIPRPNPTEIRFRREDDRVLIFVNDKQRFEIKQPEAAPFTIPFLSAGRQKAADGILGLFSAAEVR